MESLDIKDSISLVRLVLLLMRFPLFKLKRSVMSLTALSAEACSKRSASLNAALWLPSHDKPIRYIAAPMVAASDYAFRCLCRQYGVDLTYTQMLHSKNLIQSTTFQQNHLDLYEGSQATIKPPAFDELVPSQKNYILGFDQSSVLKDWPPEWDSYQRGPLIVQLAGNDVEQVLQAAQLVLARSPAIAGFDLNCGCPQAIARKGKYGAFLMEADNGSRVCEILNALRNHLPPSVAVTAKIRLPLEEKHLEDRITKLVATGIDFLTIHGRTLRENKTLVGPVNVAKICKAVQIGQSQRPNFQVVSNGGVEFFPDVDQIRRVTQTVAVMSSEALLETPQVFHHNANLLTPRQLLEEQFQMARDYLQWTALYPPLPGVLGEIGSFHVVRGHLFKFLHRYLQEHTDIRDKLATHKTHRLVHVHEIVNTLYNRYDKLSDEELLQLRSSHPNSSWYRRHWGANEARIAAADQDEMDANHQLSIQDRKRILKERIALLQVQRQAKGVTPLEHWNAKKL